jgi:hypothetical protein
LDQDSAKKSPVPKPLLKSFCLPDQAWDPEQMLVQMYLYHMLQPSYTIQNHPSVVKTIRQ